MKPYYQDSHCTIFHGDCREILSGWPRGQFDFAFTSPPYVDQREYSGGFPNKRDEWLIWLSEIIDRLLVVAKSAVINVGDRVRDNKRMWDSAALALRLEDMHVPLWERFTWVKYPAMPNGSAFRPDDVVEFCLWFGEPDFNTDNVRVPYSPATITRYKTPPGLRHASNNVRRQQSQKTAHKDGCRPSTVIITSALPTVEYCGHPAQFPLELATWFILAATQGPGQYILDPFSGSGTSLLAAKLQGLKATGIEINEKYCEIAANRLRQSVLNFEG